MKKIVLVLTTALLFVSLASAQITIGAKGIFTLNAGTKGTEDFEKSLPNIDLGALASLSTKPEMVIGGGGGLFVRYNMPFLSSLGIQAGLDVLANNGYKVSRTASIGNIKQTATTTVTYTSLELPILVTYDIGLGPVTLTVLLGPNISFPISKLKTSMTGSGFISAESGVSESSIADTAIFGITGGAAVALRLGPGSLVTDIRYINDFTPVKAGEKDSENPMDLFTRRALALSLGYQIRL